MKKKILFIMMSVLMLSLALVGCSSDDKADKDANVDVNVNEENKDEATDKDVTTDKVEESTDTIMAKGKLVMGLDDGFPPMGFKDDKGEIVGFDIDLAREATKRMGLELELKSIDWNSKALLINKGDIDVIWNGFTASEDRRKQMNFTDAYLQNKQILVVAGDSTITNKSELKDKVLGLQLGSTSQQALDKDKATKDSLKEVRDYSDNVKALLDLKIGRVDAVLVDEVVGKYYKSQKPEDYKILEDDFGEEEYVIGVRKGEAEFLEKLNQTLKEIKEDGTEAEISKKWFNEDITAK